jgi:hypothetical protein
MLTLSQLDAFDADSRMSREYIVVENAGYEGERDVKRKPSFTEASKWMRNSYDLDEIDSLHVAICVEVNGERTYEL